MSAIIEQGRIAENALNEWLSDAGLSYTAICQSADTFARLFSGNVKRPDFLVLLESVGLLAVDAKNYAYSGGVYTLEFEAELRKSLTFERLFRLPLWYAYYDMTDEVTSWYWISALKVIEVGEVRTRGDNGLKFLAIRREHFEHIKNPSDLSKLYTHRLPGTANIAATVMQQ
ncbi:hypothetical protein AGMMS49543_23870 [Betaproteobacteria bacterium]|nr:hypothetical protein AGMMS49543_23870 [Betaproteobacteria bacterium]GHU19490.1 hypothetical protein AGMMS50243_11620 [Betaproteobacteria bacterium]